MTAETFTKNGRDKNFRRLFSNTIPMTEEIWDVQERDRRCEVGKGQGSSLEKMMNTTNGVHTQTRLIKLKILAIYKLQSFLERGWRVGSYTDGLYGTQIFILRHKKFSVSNTEPKRSMSFRTAIAARR
jgi:hypothetical protein